MIHLNRGFWPKSPSEREKVDRKESNAKNNKTKFYDRFVFSFCRSFGRFLVCKWNISLPKRQAGNSNCQKHVFHSSIAQTMGQLKRIKSNHKHERWRKTMPKMTIAVKQNTNNHFFALVILWCEKQKSKKTKKDNKNNKMLRWNFSDSEAECVSLPLYTVKREEDRKMKKYAVPSARQRKRDIARNMVKNQRFGKGTEVNNHSVFHVFKWMKNNKGKKIDVEMVWLFSSFLSVPRNEIFRVGEARQREQRACFNLMGNQCSKTKMNWAFILYISVELMRENERWALGKQQTVFFLSSFQFSSFLSLSFSSCHLWVFNFLLQAKMIGIWFDQIWQKKLHEHINPP